MAREREEERVEKARDFGERLKCDNEQHDGDDDVINERERARELFHDMSVVHLTTKRTRCVPSNYTTSLSLSFSLSFSPFSFSFFSISFFSFSFSPFYFSSFSFSFSIVRFAVVVFSNFIVIFFFPVFFLSSFLTASLLLFVRFSPLVKTHTTKLMCARKSEEKSPLCSQIGSIFEAYCASH